MITDTTKLKDKGFGKRESANYAMLLLLFAGTFIWLSIMPRYNDDFWYCIRIWDWVTGERSGFPIEEIRATWQEHWEIDNGRIANILEVPLLLLPKWVTALVCTISWLWAVVKGMQICRVDLLHRSITPTALFMLCFFLPWHDEIGVQDYQLNYLMSSGIAMSALLIYLRNSRQGDSISRRTGNKLSQLLTITVCLIYGIICGAWHEGFSAPILAAIMLGMILHRKRLTIANVALAVGIAIGILILFNAPGTTHRLLNAEKESRGLISGIAISIIYHPSLIIGIISLTILSIKKRTIRLAMWKEEGMQLLATAMLISILVGLLTSLYPRTGWLGEICGIILSCRLIYDIAPRFFSRYGIRNLLLSIPLAAIVISYLAMTDYYSFVINRSYVKAHKEYASNPGQPIFYDTPSSRDIPLLGAILPGISIFENNSNIGSVRYIYPEGLPEIRPIPEALREIRLEEGERIPGNRGILRYGNYLVAPAEEFGEEYTLGRKKAKLEIDYGIITNRSVNISTIPFKSEGDGREYLYIIFLRYPFEEIIGEIRAIN